MGHRLLFGGGLAATLILLQACAGGDEGETAGAAIAAGVPDTDIYVLPIAGLYRNPNAADLRNVTDRPGYDNQPAFLPGGSAFLYSAIVDGRQADVFRYDLETETRTRLTDTKESEYSPTPMPGSGRFSTVRVEDDGAQRVWSFDMTGGDPALVLGDWPAVGYHAWINERKMLTFMVGEPTQLAVIELPGGLAEILASGVGRSIHVLRDGSGVSYMDVSEPDRPTIMAYFWRGGGGHVLIPARPGQQDYVVSRDGLVLMAEGRRIYRGDPEAGRWQLWVDLEARLPGAVTRLALSEDERLLALVALSGED
jgi:hypothetical protein